MITKNFKAIASLLLQAIEASGTALNGLIPVKDTSNTQYYLAAGVYLAFPATVITNVIASSTVSNGIWVGSGNTAATEDDYALENRITSGLSCNTPTRQWGVDADGNPYIEILFTATNTSSSAITVREIGYVQKRNCSSSVGGVGSSKYLMLDRTVLDTPVEIAAGDSAAIKYTLKTVLPS